MATHSLHTQHERLFAGNRFVYPVLSRRSGGLSVGVNLNPDKICNFDCIYCQVDRSEQSETRFVAQDQLFEELQTTLAAISSGAIFRTEKFRETPDPLRRLNDIAFSGDGEPTTYTNFHELIERSAQIKREVSDPQVKMVLITNASMFHRPHVQRGLQLLQANQGEIWAKLDAGTADYFQRIDRTPIRFTQILENITSVAQKFPLVIQSLFMKVDGQPPEEAEIDAYCGRLNDIQKQGGTLSLVQIYTIARRPAESFVTPLSDEQVDEIVLRVQRQTGLKTAAFYGATTL